MITPLFERVIQYLRYEINIIFGAQAWQSESKRSQEYLNVEITSKAYLNNFTEASSRCLDKLKSVTRFWFLNLILLPMLFNWVMTTWGPQLCHKLTPDLSCQELEQINHKITLKDTHSTCGHPEIQGYTLYSVSFPLRANWIAPE